MVLFFLLEIRGYKLFYERLSYYYVAYDRSIESLLTTNYSLSLISAQMQSINHLKQF